MWQNATCMRFAAYPQHAHNPLKTNVNSIVAGEDHPKKWNAR